MEEKYKQVTSIISDLAAKNPHITREQITKAKSMYNGDDRPIEIIKAELESYSAQIEAQAKQVEMDKELRGYAADINSPNGNTNQVNVAQESSVSETRTEHSLTSEMPAEDKMGELQTMFNDGESKSVNTSDAQTTFREDNTTIQEREKVLVRTNEQSLNSQIENPNYSNDSGYGNVEALLAITIIFSIVTIIMAFFTIIIK